MNRGLSIAAFIARCEMQKEAGIGEAVVKGGKGVQAVGRSVAGLGKAWGEGAESMGRSVTRQMRDAGKKGAGTAGALTSGALKAAPWLAGGYVGYKAFEPEVHSAKRRLGDAVRGRIALYRARRQQVAPYYHEGRFR